VLNKERSVMLDFTVILKNRLVLQNQKLFHRI